MKKGMEPAFPRTLDSRVDEVNGIYFSQNGVSVRTYAAIKAMQGILSTITLARDTDECVDIVAKAAVKHADALLEELEGEDSEKAIPMESIRGKTFDDIDSGDIVYRKSDGRKFYLVEELEK